MNTIVTGGTTFRGVALGFYSTVPANGNNEPNIGFTGLQIKPNGNLTLIENGTTAAGGYTFVGTFSTSTFYNLNYEINTSTGGLANVIYNGTDVTSSFSTTAFSATGATNLAGFFGSTANNTAFTGRVDNFTVSAIPEPSGFALSIFGLGLVAFRRRRS